MRRGSPCRMGEAGEVMARGPAVVPGYWRDPEATGRTMGDGWLRTGDIGSLDEDGFLTLSDRAKDLIISGGSNVYPREVEEVLLRHPAVREAAVIGVPDAEWGERVVACVVADPVDEQELDRHCPRRHRPLQAAAPIPVPRGPAQERLRQGAQARAARALALACFLCSCRVAHRRARKKARRSSAAERSSMPP